MIIHSMHIYAIPSTALPTNGAASLTKWAARVLYGQASHRGAHATLSNTCSIMGSFRASLPEMTLWPWSVIREPMAELTQADADALLAVEKRRLDSTAYDFPFGGQRVEIPLVSADGNEQFLLDLNRGRIRLTKMTYQYRAWKTVVLARLDLDGPPHRNPDGVELSCPHLHLYREGYGTRWAFELPETVFRNLADLYGTCHDFMAYCNVSQFPIINQRLVI